MLKWNVYPENYTNYSCFEICFTYPALLIVKFIMKLTFRALAPCHLLRRRAIRRARNTSSWSFHDGTVWLFLASLILKFSVSLLHLPGNNLRFVFSFMVRRLIEIRESLGQSQKSVSFFLIFTKLVSRRDKSWKKKLLCFILWNVVFIRLMFMASWTPPEKWESQTYFSMHDTPWSSWCALWTRTCFCQASSEFYFIIFFKF